MQSWVGERADLLLPDGVETEFERLDCGVGSVDPAHPSRATPDRDLDVADDGRIVHFQYPIIEPENSEK